MYSCTHVYFCVRLFWCTTRPVDGCQGEEEATMGWEFCNTTFILFLTSPQLSIPSRNSSETGSPNTSPRVANRRSALLLGGRTEKELPPTPPKRKTLPPPPDRGTLSPREVTKTTGRYEKPQPPIPPDRRTHSPREVTTTTERYEKPQAPVAHVLKSGYLVINKHPQKRYCELLTSCLFTVYTELGVGSRLAVDSLGRPCFVIGCPISVSHSPF
jgi:hypothetical protein